MSKANPAFTRMCPKNCTTFSLLKPSYWLKWSPVVYAGYCWGYMYVYGTIFGINVMPHFLRFHEVTVTKIQVAFLYALTYTSVGMCANHPVYI